MPGILIKYALRHLIRFLYNVDPSYPSGHRMLVGVVEVHDSRMIESQGEWRMEGRGVVVVVRVRVRGEGEREGFTTLP